MDFAQALDRMIEPFAPRLVRKRLAERMALTVMRQYDVSLNGRRTQGWRRPSSSADREVRQGLVAARNSARELVRNNKVASAAVRQVVAHLVGDGIAPRAQHPDKEIARKAQEAWDRWAEGRVDGRNDYYGTQRLAARAMVEGGEALKVWAPDAGGPDGRCRVLEGDFLDHLKNEDASRRIVQGVEFDDIGDRAGYWLFGSHPGDMGGYRGNAVRFDAAHVDHLFDELRPGQTRGISWLAPFALDLRDIADGDQAWLMRHKAEACIALILTPGEDDTPSGPFNEVNGEGQAGGGPGKGGLKPSESLRPGMIFRARKGETASTLSPTPSGGATEFKKQQIMGIAANLAPYHLISGDPSKANYSSLRAMSIGFFANLDDWQQNIMLPLDCKPAWERRMRRLYLDTGDRRFLEVTAKWAMPARPYIDKLKDVAGEVAEIRAGLKSQSRSLSERGLNIEDHLDEMQRDNQAADARGLALETDPRRVTQSGILQAATGYLAGQSQSNEDN